MSDSREAWTVELMPAEEQANQVHEPVERGQEGEATPSFTATGFQMFGGDDAAMCADGSCVIPAWEG